MTHASRTTYAQWSEPDKQRIQKLMLSTLQQHGRKTYPHLFHALDLHHTTGTGRLQELLDMGIVETCGEETSRRNGRRSTRSWLRVSSLGWRLLLQPDPDAVLAEMNKARRALEDKRADAMRDIRRDHVAAVRLAVQYVVGEV